MPRTEEYAKYWEWAKCQNVLVSKQLLLLICPLHMIDLYLPYAEGTGYSSVQVGSLLDVQVNIWDNDEMNLTLMHYIR